MVKWLYGEMCHILDTKRIAINLNWCLNSGFIEYQFLGAFAKFRKAIITFVTSVRPSVYPHGTTRLHWTGFHRIRYFSLFRKYVEKIQVSL
jgi:hypothetical protein